MYAGVYACAWRGVRRRSPERRRAMIGFRACAQNKAAPPLCLCWLRNASTRACARKEGLMDQPALETLTASTRACARKEGAGGRGGAVGRKCFDSRLRAKGRAAYMAFNGNAPHPGLLSGGAVFHRATQLDLFLFNRSEAGPQPAAGSLRIGWGAPLDGFDGSRRYMMSLPMAYSTLSFCSTIRYCVSSTASSASR